MYKHAIDVVDNSYQIINGFWVAHVGDFLGEFPVFLRVKFCHRASFDIFQKQ